MSTSPGYRVPLDFTVATATVPGYAVGLEFEPGDPGTPTTTILVGGTLPVDAAFGGTLAIQYIEHATLTAGGTLPVSAAFGGAITLAYDSRVARPEARLADSAYQQATGLGLLSHNPFADTSRTGRHLQDTSQQAARIAAEAASAFETAARLSASVISRAQQAARLAAGTISGFETGASLRHSLTDRTQQADRAATAPARYAWQIAAPLRRQFAAPFEQAGVNRTMRLRSIPELPLPPGYAVRLEFALQLQQPRDWAELQGGPLISGRADGMAARLRIVITSPYQDAMRPPPAAEKPDEPGPGPGPGPEPPEALIVVPLRGIYMIHNTITLNRASDGLPLPVTGVELTIDDSSFTWGWSATAGGTAEVAALLAALDPDSGEPVEVELGINGVAYRLLTDPVDRQRQFPRTTLRIPGRGLAAELDAPVARQMVFSQSAARTAQQLAGEALQVNGVGIGWDVDWGLTDWLVPGGVWSHQGTHISAVAAIAGAAGGYLQPHRTARTLRVLPRYPAPPWDWPGLTPDYELPIGPVTVEGIQWQRLPDYNRVYVFGEAEPVRGRVTRAGTDGAIEAPMVTNPLITAAEAVLQAGTAVLGNTGKQALVTLTLPVLAETGVILPGALVRYVDGSESRLGLVRSTSVSWQRPKLRQSIKVETHILEGA